MAEPRTAAECLAKQEGGVAFSSGRLAVDIDMNPHKGGQTMQGFNQLRYWWFVGWLTAKWDTNQEAGTEPVADKDD